MKKFTLTLVMVLVTILTFGQAKSVPTKVRGAALKAERSVKAVSRVAERPTSVAPKVAAKAPRKAPSVVTELPAGTLKTYTRSGSYFAYDSETGTYSVAEQSGTAKIVFAEDGTTVYLSDPIYGNDMGSWVQGTLSSNGTTITVPLGQYIMYDEEEGYGAIIAMLDVTDGEGGITATYDEEATEVTYTIDGTTVTLNGTSETRAFGAVWDDDYAMSYGLTGNIGTVYEEYTFEEPDKIVPPEGLETTQLTWVGRAYVGGYSTIKYNVEIGFADSDVYIKGFDNTLPEAWIAGFYDEGTGEIAFPAGQYLGLDSDMNPHYLMGSEDLDVPTDLVYTMKTTSDGKMVLSQKTQYYSISYSDSEVSSSFEYLGYASGMHNLEAITVPSTLSTGMYTMTYQHMSSSEPTATGTESKITVQLGIDGNKAYLKNLDSAANTNGWIVGTVNGSQITFEAPQLFDANGKAVFLAYDRQTEEMVDNIVFNYNASTKYLTQADNNTIVVNSALVGGLYYYELMENAETGAFEEPDKVVPPTGLETVDAFLAGYLNSGSAVATIVNVKVGFADEDVYVQGIDRTLPENWVRGTLNTSTNVVTFDPQYIGMLDGVMHYLVGTSGNDVTGMQFTYKPLSDGKFILELTNPTFYSINTSETSLSFVYYGYSAAIHNLAPITEKPEGLDTNIYTYNYTKVASSGNTAASKNVFFGVLDGKAYIKGLANSAPNVWVVGTVDGNKITFNTPQSLDADGEIMLLGYDRANTTFLESVEFEYDPTTQLIAQTDDNELVVNSVLLNRLYTYEVMKQGSTAAFADELVTPPAGLETTTKFFEGRKYNGSTTIAHQNITYGVDGTDVYIKGLFAELPDVWVKGTLADDESTITIPTNQYLGLYNDKVAYLTGYSGGVKDIVLTKSQHGIYRTNTYMLPATAKGGTSFHSGLYYYTAAAIAPTVPASVTPPATLETSEFSLTSSAETTARTVLVGFDGDDVYIQGIFNNANYINAWIKGTKSGGRYVFVTPQRLGNYYMYFIGFDGTNLVDEVEFTYDAETNTFTLAGTYLINGNIASAYYTQIVTEATLVGPEPDPTGIDDITAGGVNGTDSDEAKVWYNINGVRVDKPTQKGIYIKNGKKVVVK